MRVKNKEAGGWESQTKLLTETTEQRGRQKRGRQERRRGLRTGSASDAKQPLSREERGQSWGEHPEKYTFLQGREGVASLRMPAPLKHASLPSSPDCQLCRNGDDAMYFHLNAYNSAR